MRCLYCCCCTLLVLLNIVYLIIGILILAVGVFLNSFGSVINQYPTPLLQQTFGPMTKSAGLIIDINSFINTILVYMDELPVGLIVVGVFLIVIAILGMCSVCCKSKLMLMIYIPILSGIILFQTIYVIISAMTQDVVETQLRLSNIMASMIAKYQGFNATNVESVAINQLNIFYGCCGINNYLDFATSVNWQRKISVVYTYGNKNYNINTTLLFPLSCCIFNNSVPQDLNACISSNISNMNIGCVNKFFNATQSYLPLVYRIIGGIISYQGFLVLVGIIYMVSLEQPAKPV